MVCCAPGGTNCQHPGQWRATEVGTRVCAAGALPGHPDACAHKPDPDMARSHWSCCADLNRASNTCLRQPTHAHTHPGDWRVSSAKRYTKHCSPTWEVEGRVCKHGAVIQASHWSWYVWSMCWCVVLMIDTVFSPPIVGIVQYHRQLRRPRPFERRVRYGTASVARTGHASWAVAVLCMHVSESRRCQGVPDVRRAVSVERRRWSGSQ